MEASEFGELGSYHILIRDLREFLEFVHPTNENAKVFSHRGFALLLRSCTEFENLCKVAATKVELKTGALPKIHEFSVLKDSLGLKDAKAVFSQWTGQPLILDPLHGWEQRPKHLLEWYKGYNNVKHDRSNFFKDANLSNVLNAIAACFLLLVGMRVMRIKSWHHEHLENEMLEFSFPGSLFSVIIPSSSYETTFALSSR